MPIHMKHSQMNLTLVHAQTLLNICTVTYKRMHVYSKHDLNCLHHPRQYTKVVPLYCIPEHVDTRDNSDDTANVGRDRSDGVGQAVAQRIGWEEYHGRAIHRRCNFLALESSSIVENRILSVLSASTGLRVRVRR